MTVTAEQFNYDLDPGLIAQAPLPQRQESRLMRLRRSDGDIQHCRFWQLPQLLAAGDLLVVNDTAVIPARFFCRRATGGHIEGLFLREPEAGLWEIMLKNAGRCRIGEAIAFVDDDASLTLRENLGQGQWLAAVEPSQEAIEILQRVGTTPLPPYIHREESSPDAADRSRYQTVFASEPGAVAAPTAGLHFSTELLDRLAEMGVEQARVTLHVGPGTFLPVKVDDVSQHKMHSEWYELPAASAAKINAARNAGRRIVAVGTTSVRVLETAAATALPLQAARGWTDIFIYPPARFRAVDALITNFHLPRSTLLMLVAAFCSPGSAAGIATILDAYQEAIRQRYRFYSYGDAMLILP